MSDMQPAIQAPHQAGGRCPALTASCCPLCALCRESREAPDSQPTTAAPGACPTIVVWPVRLMSNGSRVDWPEPEPELEPTVVDEQSSRLGLRAIRTVGTSVANCRQFSSNWLGSMTACNQMSGRTSHRCSLHCNRCRHSHAWHLAEGASTSPSDACSLRTCQQACMSRHSVYSY